MKTSMSRYEIINCFYCHSVFTRTVHQFCPNNTIFFPTGGGLQSPQPRTLMVTLKKSPVFRNMLSTSYTRESVSRTAYASNFKCLSDTKSTYDFFSDCGVCEFSCDCGLNSENRLAPYFYE